MSLWDGCPRNWTLIGFCANAIWEALFSFKVYRFGYLPSVPAVVTASAEYIPSSRFLSDMWSSSYRVVTAWLLALALGVPLGLLIGWKKSVRDILFPAIE